MRRLLCCMGVACALTLSARADEGMTVAGDQPPPDALAWDGKACAHIVLPRDDRELSVKRVVDRKWQAVPNRFAAQFLQEQIERVTGVRIPIVSETNALPGLVLVVGQCDFLEQHGVTGAGLGPEGFRVQRFRDGIGLVGEISPHGVDRGVLFAVYEFCQQALGIRWYFPGELGTVVPRRLRVVLPDLDISRSPVFRLRRGVVSYPGWSFVDSLWSDAHPVFRYGTSMDWPVNHTEILWYRNFGATHPEHFAMGAAGVRLVPTSGYNSYLCYSSADLLTHMLAQLRRYDAGERGAWLADSCVLPTPERVPFMPSDVYPGCHCEACRALTHAQRNYQQVHSDLMADFWIRYANAMAMEWPGRRLAAGAYASYLWPPENIDTLPDNVDVTACVGSGPQMYNQPAVEHRESGPLMRWSELLQHDRNRLQIWFYSYYPNCFQKAPIFNPHDLARWHRRWKDRVVGVFNNGFGYGAADKSFPRGDLNLVIGWLWHRLLWDPEADVDALMDQHCLDLYGPAAPPVRDFYALLAERWENARWQRSGARFYVAPSDLFEIAYPPDVVGRLREHLAEAHGLAPENSMERRRVDWLRETHAPFFEQSRLYAEWQAKGVPTATCAIMTTVPSVTSIVPEAVWSGVEAFSLVQREFGEPPVAGATVQTACAGGTFTIRAVLEWNEEEPAALARQKEGDSVAFQIIPFAHGTAYHEVKVFPDGRLETRIRSNENRLTPWTPNHVRAVTVQESSRWFLLLSIPMEDLAVTTAPGAETRWRLQVWRRHPSSTYFDPGGEYGAPVSVWSPTFVGLDTPSFNRFGVLRFAPGTSR